MSSGVLCRRRPTQLLSLLRIVEDDPDGVPHTRADAAHAVAQVHPVVALRSLHWPVMDCKGHGIALTKWHDFGAALHARPLLGQHELAACEVLAGLRKEDCNLNRECEITVEVLMQTVEVTWDILQQKRRWTGLTAIVASL
jgi:hypothetical protein